DFYKQVPELPAVVRGFHDRGLRVFMEYHAWDRGARVERDDAAELAMMVVNTGIDGVFLDSMREAPAGVRAKLDATGRPGALDRATLSAMLSVQRRFARHLSHGEWTPLADADGADAPSLFSSRFELGGSRLWTIFGREGYALGPADAILADARERERWFELTSGRELTPVV